MLDTLLLRPSPHCNTSLHFSTLHPTTLHHTSSNYTSSHFILLHFTTLHHTSSNYTSPHFIQLPFTTLHPTTFHNTSSNYTSPHFIQLHFTTLHPTTLIDTSLPLIYISPPFYLAEPNYISYRSISPHLTKLDTVLFSHLQTNFQNNEPLRCPKEPLTISLHFFSLILSTQLKNSNFAISLSAINVVCLTSPSHPLSLSTFSTLPTPPFLPLSSCHVSKG